MMNRNSRWFAYGPAFQAAQVEETDFILPPSCAALNGRTLLFMSDVHLSNRFPADCVERLLMQVESLKPDMLLLGGDYAESPEWQTQFFDMLGGLRFPLGAYAVLGNNDQECFPNGETPLIRMAERAGVQFLLERTVRIRKGGAAVTVAGLDEYLRTRLPRKPLFQGKDEPALRILLAHYPQSVLHYLKATPGPVPHLGMAGHTHGGQFKLLGLTPFSIGFERWVMNGFRPAVSGWTELSGSRLLVSPGLGTSRIPVRINVEPTIHRIRLSL